MIPMISGVGRRISLFGGHICVCNSRITVESRGCFVSTAVDEDIRIKSNEVKRVKCYICGGAHTDGECPQKEGAGKRLHSLKCYKCGEYGHRQHECPADDRRNRKNTTLTDVESSSTESSESKFRVLEIPGFNTDSKVDQWRPQAREEKKMTIRAKKMPSDQDWTAVWPAAKTFMYSAVPLPLRQGIVKRKLNNGIPPGKYANAELMKIPNFLHLTPKHIKQHCTTLKQFCSAWPADLETEEQQRHHLPVTIVTRDYVFDGTSRREYTRTDNPARQVTLQVKLSDLGLKNEHDSRKFKQLVAERYDPQTDAVTITSAICPTKKQNTDYVKYLLTVVYFESQKMEEWEQGASDEDLDRYIWREERSPGVERVLQAKRKRATILGQDEAGEVAEVFKPEVAISPPEVVRYKEAIEMMAARDDVESTEQYKMAAMELLLGVAPVDKGHSKGSSTLEGHTTDWIANMISMLKMTSETDAAFKS